MIVYINYTYINYYNSVYVRKDSIPLDYYIALLFPCIGITILIGNSRVFFYFQLYNYYFTVHYSCFMF